MTHPGHDPLTVLHGDEVPVQPDPAFAARLRARLEAAVNLPARTEEVVMSGTDTVLAGPAEPGVESTVPRPAALPYLAVGDARGAIAWYREVFGAAVVGEPIEMADGRIGHAELSIGGGELYLSDEFPELGIRSPAPGAVSVSLVLPVTDTDAVAAHARRRGARVQRGPYEAHGSRMAAIVDPFGHRWMLSGPLTGAPVPIQHGDTGLLAVCTPDPDRAARFYAHVLGWRVDPASRRVTNTEQPVELIDRAAAQGMLCCYAVADLQAARASILAAGGRVGGPRRIGPATVLEATDPTGVVFGVYEPAPDTPRPRLNGAGPGELSYLTYEVGDSAAFRAFYGHVLFWSYEPGRIEDGWGIQQTHPMAGVAGGNDRSAVVPMWTVADIADAVARVREAGGTVLEEPSRQPYGMSALCTDDQGTRFYLGQP
ncbi:hypothetical protein MHAS_00216 [Mycolicibacterium hassiacum DSM 44199]|nr:VOC family protein [Mycolicibacterium hassiacum]MBX5485891.1 VOC family protein [Mycolicibacterium hassiacum]MDA4088188.1 glyoxalase [Mycolicibacterium hassiacum DSM 44199]PZN16305.1 MAG: glyoxalase [Mycolicibacterium hassiacum]VCT88532.1 hypothetical protein MHAS_00216 [Mycolicibacterium hassiacum DSM 44199]